MSKLKGFTIIELIVVIGIIAVLAGIVLVGVSQYRRKAQISRARAELHQMQIAMSLYYDKYGHYPVTTDSSVNPFPEFYSDWSATYFCSDCVYRYEIYDANGSGKPNCASIYFDSDILGTAASGTILCEGCPEGCGDVIIGSP
jgi:prepilin-type N-terminal cleavage/methylation domain-containing protein